MEAVQMTKPLRRGRPKRRIFDPALLTGWNPRPEGAAAWFAVGDHIAMLRSEGYAAEDIALHFGVSPATVSRWVRGARWPRNIRGRILLKAESFPVPVLMRLARTTFRDQGSQTASDGRKGPKSRLTLLGAVLTIIEGKKLPRPADNARERAGRLERALVDERGRRQALSEECQRLREDRRQLEQQLSADALTQALRRVRELEAEVVRLRVLPGGGAAARKPKSPDLEYQDDRLQAALGCRVDTIDWAAGLLLIRAGNGDILDGVRERLMRS